VDIGGVIHAVHSLCRVWMVVLRVVAGENLTMERSLCEP
jgi:hypothetical protein